jgi:hypothetical protein
MSWRVTCPVVQGHVTAGPDGLLPAEYDVEQVVPQREALGEQDSVVEVLDLRVHAGDQPQEPPGEGQLRCTRNGLAREQGRTAVADGRRLL